MKDHLHHKNSLVKNIFAMGILGLTLYLGQFNTVEAMPIEGPAISQTPTLSSPQETLVAPINWRTSTPTKIPTAKPTPTPRRTNTPWPTSTSIVKEPLDYTARIAQQCVATGGTYVMEDFGEVFPAFCASAYTLPQGCIGILNRHPRVVYCYDGNQGSIDLR